MVSICYNNLLKSILLHPVMAAQNRIHSPHPFGMSQTCDTSRQQKNIVKTNIRMPEHTNSLQSQHVLQNLKILQWNANGILPRLPDLKNYIANLNQQPDIICIQETHLTAVTSLKLPNYTVERRDRPGGGKHGGVATLIKSSLIYTVLENIEEIEELTIRVKLNDQYLIISNIYNPPKKNN